MSYRIPISLERLAFLQKEIKQFTPAFALLSEQIVIADENANIVYANHAAEELSRWPLSEIIGKTPGDLWGGQMPKPFYERMWKIIKEDKIAFTAEVKNKRKNGEIYWCETHIFPILNKDGSIRLFIAIELDITARKEKEVLELKKHKATEKRVEFMANQEANIIDLKNRIRELEAELRSKKMDL